jgi:hypothetical protein
MAKVTKICLALSMISFAVGLSHLFTPVITGLGIALGGVLFSLSFITYLLEGESTRSEHEVEVRRKGSSDSGAKAHHPRHEQAAA